jgi:hypothetical protein
MGLAFGTGLVLGGAWANNWGNCNWNHGDVNINNNNNFNRNANRNVNRGLGLARATRGSTTRNTEEMRPMGTDKPRRSTVARLGERVAHLELASAEAPVPEHDPAEGLVDRVSVEATDRAAVGRKVSGLVIGPLAELVPETSVPAIAPAVGQGPAARVREPVRCRRAAAVAQIASAIGLSHQAPGSVRVAMLLVAVGLTEAPLDRPVIAEVPAWEAVESAVVVAEEADVLAEADVVAVVADVGDDKTVEEEK